MNLEIEEFMPVIKELTTTILTFIIAICIIGAVAFSGVIKPLLLLIGAGAIAYLLKKAGVEQKYVVAVFVILLIFLMIGFKTNVLTLLP